MKMGLLRSLFDLSFSSLVTPKVVKFVYVITLIVIGFVAVFFIIATFTQSAAYGVVPLLVLAALASLRYAIYARVVSEFIIAVFRLVEYNGELLALKRQQLGLAPSPQHEAPSADDIPPANA